MTKYSKEVGNERDARGKARDKSKQVMLSKIRTERKERRCEPLR
jgi:hypothetical protein